MYKVLKVFPIANKYCVSVEGQTILLRNGMSLRDEKGNVFIIESTGMVSYRNIKDYERFAELILNGNVKNIGENLEIVPF